MGKLKSGLSSLFDIAKNKVTGVEQEVSDEIRQERLSTCLSCPKLMKATNQCGSCLCFVKLKTKYKQESCPEGKWDKVE